jgi:hypothetical protein
MVRVDARTSSETGTPGVDMPAPTALILADTHVPHFRQELPASLGPYLEACDVILHAGDVTDPAVLDEFAAHAPVLADSSYTAFEQALR